MYSDYEESFYYEKPSSAGTDAAGEALGLGIGMGIGAVSIILTAILLKIQEFFMEQNTLVLCLSYQHSDDSLVNISNTLTDQFRLP